MSSVLTPRSCSTAYSASPKSSPTGPTTRTSVKNDAASEKCTADPPSIRLRSPNGVLIKVSRAGMNYADTHQRTNDYLTRYELPLVPGGEVAGVREDTGERVVA